MVFLFPEGATPIDDISDLKLSWVRTRAQLNQVEAENILEAYSKYFYRFKTPNNWLNEKFFKQVHFDMFGKIWEWAGSYYKGPMRNIGVSSFQIPLQVQELCQDILFWLNQMSDLTFLEQSIRIHHRLAKIHPFTNGNGRHARFIADFYLYCLQGKKPSWPEQNLSTENFERKKYILAMKKADLGDYSLLVDLVKSYGGKNPSIADVLSLPFFSKNFTQKKICEIINNLINFGADINEPSSFGLCPLAIAKKKDYAEVVNLLMQKGAYLTV